MHAIYVPDTKENRMIASVAATMAIEGMPLNGEDIDELMRIARGETTTERLRRDFLERIRRENAEENV